MGRKKKHTANVLYINIYTASKKEGCTIASEKLAVFTYERRAFIVRRIINVTYHGDRFIASSLTLFLFFFFCRTISCRALSPLPLPSESEQTWISSVIDCLVYNSSFPIRAEEGASLNLNIRHETRFRHLAAATVRRIFISSLFPSLPPPLSLSLSSFFYPLFYPLSR